MSISHAIEIERFFKRVAIVWVSLLMAFSAAAQAKLSFSGLKRTQLSFLALNLENVEVSNHPDTLLWEVPQAEIDAPLISAFRQNLVNLPQIQGASYSLNRENVGGQTIAYIHWELVEAQSITPLLSFGGVEGNVHFLVGVNDQNLFGRGQELMGFYQNIQGEHNFLVAYKNPAVRNSRYGISAELSRYAAEEPVFFPAGSANYLYVNENVSIGSSYLLRPRHIVDFGLTLFRENFTLLDKPNEILGAPERLSINKLLLKTGHKIDRRNYIYERVQGSHNSTVIQGVLNTNDEPFLIAWHELRYYGLVGKRGNWATRLRLGIASNRDSPFAPFVLDSQFNIRGSGNRVDRGSAQVVLNVEYRHLVWRNRKENFWIQTVGFSDLGTWRSPGGRFSELTNGTTLRQFVGGGVRFISAKAKNAVLRVDYGIDVTNSEQRGFVLGFGQYF